ncbi:MAG: hypothetical protein B7X00_00455, partial [Legionella sp. 21-45-4]
MMVTHKVLQKLLLLLSVSLSGHALAATLTQLTLHNQANQASIEARFNGRARPHVFVLTHPDRLVIDFPQTSTHLNTQHILRSSGLIETVRKGQPVANTLRFVFDAKRGLGFNEEHTASMMRIHVNAAPSKQKSLPPSSVKANTLHKPTQVAS